jgi:hypothetical protein
LISLEFVRTLGYTDNADGKLIDMEDCPSIQFANGSTVLSCGTVQLRISFYPPNERQPSVCELVEQSEQPEQPEQSERFQNPYYTYNRWEESINPTQSEISSGVINIPTVITEPFHVIEDLHFDVMLGETLLATVDAYNQHAGNFASDKSKAPDIIAVGRKTVSGEGSKEPRIEKTEEEQFKDDFSNAFDRFEKETQEIEDRINSYRITQSDAQNLKHNAHQTYSKWLGENKNLLDRYHPGWYEQNVPQEVE